MSSTSTTEEKACDKNGRIRTENWEYAHKVDLVDIIREHVNVIENKKTDAAVFVDNDIFVDIVTLLLFFLSAKY